MATKTPPKASPQPAAKRAKPAVAQRPAPIKKTASALGVKAAGNTVGKAAAKSLPKAAAPSPARSQTKAGQGAKPVAAPTPPAKKSAVKSATSDAANTKKAKMALPASRTKTAPIPKKPKALSPHSMVTGKHIVCFWKQNDLGLFGRRPDRWIALWEQDPNVEKVLVFETPLSALALQEWLKRALALDPASGSEYRLLLDQALAKLQGHCDTAKTVYKTYLTPTDKPANNQDYLQWVLQQVKEQGIASPSVVLWPACFANRALVRAMKPKQVITDLVDDQRLFASNAQLVPTITAQYQMWLAESDVVVSDSPGIISAFAQEFSRPDICYLPNAALVTKPGSGKVAKPRPTKSAKKRLIVGYSGNLRERLDTDALLNAIADNPDKEFWFVGATHGSAFYASARALPNCTFWGTLRQQELQARVAQFDVAIDPLLQDAASERMSASSADASGAIAAPLVALSALKRF